MNNFATPNSAEILLINMPFSALFRPSIALSLLKAALTRAGYHSEVVYFSLRLAERIGADCYLRFANQAPRPSDLAGEWIFSSALFDGEVNASDYLHQVLLRKSPVFALESHAPENVAESFIEQATRLHAVADGFIHDCLQTVVNKSPRVVGFTSVFQQHVASLALAKKIKKILPDTFIVFGGGNCEGVTGAELARSFPFVDAVVSGEADRIFPEIVRRALCNEDVADLPGVYTSSNVANAFSTGRFNSAPSVQVMDELPYPDYSDYFRQLEVASLDREKKPEILFETSRGCWWGERNHCTFCGLSEQSMPYRSKSAGRALEELAHLTSKYPSKTVTVVDNILDVSYFKDFVPQLASSKLDIQLFYEVKANLKKEQLQSMRDAGIRMIQPGVESFSSHILELMKKGVKSIQNIQLLKWCKEFGIHPYWNIIWGFPGETAEDYYAMAEMLPLLTHLPPPQSAGPIRLDRFSPNYELSEQFGFRDVEPCPAYACIFPFEPSVVRNLSYYFTYSYANGQNVKEYVQQLIHAVARWMRECDSSDLFVEDDGQALHVWDFRRIARDPLTLVTEVDRDLYLFCDRIRTLKELRMSFNRDDEEIQRLLQPFLHRGLMVRENQSYLSLAVQKTPHYEMASNVRQRYESCVAKLHSLRASLTS